MADKYSREKNAAKCEADAAKGAADAAKGAAKGAANAAKGAKLCAKNYKILLPEGATNVVNIIDKTRGTIGKTGTPVGKWIVRLDNPHRGAPFEHININRAVSGVPDPHLPISPNILQAGKTTAEYLKKANKVLLPLAITMDTARVGCSIYKDVQNGTSRTTAKTAASVAGGWCGGYGGVMSGAAIGSMIFPGIGTIVGGFIGGVAGGIGGAIAAEKVVDGIGDEVDWDIEILICERCGEKYKCRKYCGDSRKICPNCV